MSRGDVEPWYIFQFDESSFLPEILLQKVTFVKLAQYISRLEVAHFEEADTQKGRNNKPPTSKYKCFL